MIYHIISASSNLGKTETKLENMKSEWQTSKDTSGKTKEPKLTQHKNGKSGAPMVKNEYIVVLLITIIAFISIKS